MTTKLKPCPFCGNPPKVSYRINFLVECWGCDIQIKARHTTPEDEKRDAAIKRWNRRPEVGR